MKRERDRQVENSKTATAALREDAETQRRLAGLLEKEKTELKTMLQEKWKEARHLKDRLEESEAKLYEAGHSMDNWQQTKRDLEGEVIKLKREREQRETAAQEVEDRLGAELKDATSRASQMAAELTTLKHSALWNDRELGNKVQLLTREVEVLNGQLAAKDAALERSQASEGHLKGVCEELKSVQEAQAAEMRTKVKEIGQAHQVQLEKLREEMRGLRQRSLEAQEGVQRMKVEVRARRLESESLARELKSMTATSDENARSMEQAEQSRTALLNELDRTRQDTTDMVKQMVEERNAAADEAGALARNISGLNARIRQLTDELDQAHRSRKSLRSKLRRQVINELRGSGWTPPKGYSSNVLIDPMDDEDGLGFGGGAGGGGGGGGRRNEKKSPPKAENPIAKMRRLRQALTQSGAAGERQPSSESNTSSPSSQKRSKRGGVAASATLAPPAIASKDDNTTPPPTGPATPEISGKKAKTTVPMEYKIGKGKHGSVIGPGGGQQGEANDLGSPIDIVDRNPRDIGFAPPGSAGSNPMGERDTNASPPGSSDDPVEVSTVMTFGLCSVFINLFYMLLLMLLCILGSHTPAHPRFCAVLNRIR